MTIAATTLPMSAPATTEPKSLSDRRASDSASASKPSDLTPAETQSPPSGVTMKPMKPMQPMTPMKPLQAPERWWPEGLGENPSSAGGQNQTRYAFFADKQRLAVDSGNGNI